MRRESEPGTGQVHSIGELQEVMEKEQEEMEIVPASFGKTTQISQEIEFTFREELQACVRKNSNIFACSYVELVGIPAHVAKHKLNIIPVLRPVKQKKSHFWPKKDKVIAEQVQELLQAGQI